MTEDNPIATWLIELEGRESDLVEWARVFRDTAIASVWQAVGRDEKNAYFVRSQRLDGLKDTEVHLESLAVLAAMNAAVKVWTAGVRPVGRAWLWYERADGTREPMKQVVASMHLPIAFLAGVGARGVAGFIGPSEPQLTVAIARTDPVVAEALEHFAEPDNWFDFWKTYEVIEADVGGQKNLKKKNWADKHEVDNFCANCQHYRHSRASRSRPKVLKRILTRDEAREFLRRLFQAWLHEKGGF